MNYLPELLFLVSISSLSFMIFLLFRILDFLNADSRQKIAILKIGLTLIGLSPFIFYLCRLISWHTIQITLQGEFINQLSAHTAPATFTHPGFSWSFYIVAVYGAGLFLMLTRIIFSYLSARKLLANSSPAFIHGELVFINKNIQTPLSFGFPTAKIYFPFNAEEKWNTRQIQISLVHERIHLRRNDSSWKFLSLVVQAFLFFLPWAYFLHRRLELEMEIYCDEKTCADTGADTQEYGKLLLAMTCAQPQNLIFCNITNSTLKRRFIAMKNRSYNAPFLTSILSIALLLAGTTAIVMASGISKNKTCYNIVSRILIDGKLVSSPRIITYENEKALIVLTNKDGSPGLKMALIAKNIDAPGIKDAIGMNYDIEYQNSKEKIHTKPQLVAAPNREAVIKLSSDSGHIFEMHVLAQRQ